MDKNLPIIDDTFIVHKTLGVGFTSKVVLAEHRDTGYQLAIKIFKPIKHYKIVLESFRKEVDSMKNLRHENLINIIAANECGVYVNGKEQEKIMYLGVELAENAELFDFIADPGKEFSESFARLYFRQIIDGLHSMHQMKVAHRDLKTENLFLDKEFKLKIGDFGFSKFMDPEKNDGKLRTQLGTSGYQSPELLEGQAYDGAANDIFSLGVILFILVKAYPPFREARKTDSWYRHLYYEKFDNFWMAHSKRGANISNELIELITGMLRYKNRYTIEDILKSKWFNGELPDESLFVSEMNLRKKIVDSRREKEANEALLSQQNQGNTGMLYRAKKTGKEDEIYDSLKNLLLEKKVFDSQPKIWDSHKSRYLINLGADLKEGYLKLIRALVDEQVNLELSQDVFTFSGDSCFIPNLDQEEKEDETSNTESNIFFNGELYADYENNSIKVELVKSRDTDPFTFKEFVESVVDGLVKN